MNEQKNLLLAIVASLLILLIFQYFFPDDSTVNTVKNNELEKLEKNEDEIILPKTRDAILESEKRIFLSGSSRLKVSVSLKCARFDDIILRDYKENISEESPLVTILSPKETLNPYFAEFGWATQSNVDLPTTDTVWKLVKGKKSLLVIR